MVLPGELEFAAEALHTPQVGVSVVGKVLSWFPDGLYGKGTWGTLIPQQGTGWCQRASGSSLSPVSVTDVVSVTPGPHCPSCPPVSPGWVGVGVGDLSLTACLPSETLGVGADAAVSYGPPTPMLLLCLGSGCGLPLLSDWSGGPLHAFPRASSLRWPQGGQPSFEASLGY